MDQHLNAASDLKEIRRVMENSSTFLSLSGLSGVVVGLIALGAGTVMSLNLKTCMPGPDLLAGIASHNGFHTTAGLFLGGVLALSLASAALFTWLKARRRGQPLGDKTSLRFALNLFVPLAAGGLFAAGLMLYGYYPLILPSFLVFYGLALYNASKYTVHDIGILGMIETALGLAALFLPALGLLLWTAGFGLMTLVYGIIMVMKYGK